MQVNTKRDTVTFTVKQRALADKDELEKRYGYTNQNSSATHSQFTT